MKTYRPFWSPLLTLAVVVLSGCTTYTITEVPRDEAHVHISPEQRVRLLRTVRRHSARDLYIAPNIPPRKLSNARRTCVTPQGEEVLGLIDSTVFGSANNCLIVGSSGIYFRNDWASDTPGRSFLPYAEMRHLLIAKKNRYEVSIGGLCFNVSGSSMSGDAVAALLQEVQMTVAGDLPETTASEAVATVTAGVPAIGKTDKDGVVDQLKSAKESLDGEMILAKEVTEEALKKVTEEAQSKKVEKPKKELKPVPVKKEEAQEEVTEAVPKKAIEEAQSKKVEKPKGELKPVPLKKEEAQVGLENALGTEKVVSVIFAMDPATIRYRYEGEKQIPMSVFEYDPRKDITASLEQSGFKVVSQDSTSYDLTLRIIHRERARQTGRFPGDTSSKIMIDHIGFVLEDKDGAILLKEGRGPFGTYESMTAVKQSFVKDLVELVQIRIEEADETSCWIEFVSRRGDEASLIAMEKAGDPEYAAREEQVIVLKPMLRSHKYSSRVVSLHLLEALGYTPASDMEGAAFFIVQTYPFHRWSAQVGEMTPGAWAARQGVISVIRHGTTAIDLLVEDLKGKQDLNKLCYGVEDGGVATRAKAVLMRLSKERWAKFDYSKRATIGRGVEYIDRKPEADFFHVKYSDWGKLLGEVEVVNPERASELYSRVWNEEWSDYAIVRLSEMLEKGRTASIDEHYLRNSGISNQDYLQDIIEILGNIADSGATQVLKTYLDHPELAGAAKKAIENIEKRAKWGFANTSRRML